MGIKVLQDLIGQPGVYAGERQSVLYAVKALEALHFFFVLVSIYPTRRPLDLPAFWDKIHLAQFLLDGFFLPAEQAIDCLESGRVGISSFLTTVDFTKQLAA